VAAHPPAGGPLARTLGAGPAPVGLLGIEPATRRRMRVNGRGTLDALGRGPAAVGLLGIEPETRRRMRVNGTGTLAADGLTVRTEQVYSNCPKYIQRRHVAAAEGGPPPRAVERERMSAGDRRQIAAADTFVIATAGPDGADASHRGGSPGFVAVLDEGRLRFPDYPGNTMYMTLGNLESNPRAGLLFLDWETGDALQLSGRAAIDWSAERAVDFTVERVVATARAVPYRWALDERSRFNPPL